MRHRAEFLLYRIVKGFALLFPRRLCLLLGSFMGLTVYLADKKHRQIALSNLKIAFKGELPPRRLRRISWDCFLHFGRFILETIKFPYLKEEKKKRLFLVEGKENLEKALLEGRGVLLFTAHYGNWEIASYIISRIAKLNVIARSLDNKLIERDLLKLRNRIGGRVIYKHQARKEILLSLREKEIAAILIDQNVLRSQAVFVDFFGKKAATTPSLAAFFLRTRSPIVPGFCYPSSSNKYRIKIFEPLEISLTGNQSQDVLKITQICTKIIETQIRENPSYWLWFHKRWKTRPEGERQSQGSFPSEEK